MKVTGIIAEYNPFHNGHLYQLRKAKHLTECDYTVIIMSGNFVQRGAPALVDKRVRAEAALRCGADLVLELPVLYATASAEFFAAGAVALLDRLGVVTHLCFGSECGNEKALQEIARILSEEPPRYRAALKASLRQGATYPAARVQALAASAHSDLPGDFESLLSSPNNILGIEYIRAIQRRGSRILPATVRRLGAGYHDAGLLEGRLMKDGLPEDGLLEDGLLEDNLPENGRLESNLPEYGNVPSPENACSALAIRQAISQGDSLAQLRAYMPSEVSVLLGKYLDTGKCLFLDDFSSVLYYKLISEKASGYEKYLDVSSDLSDRIRKHLRFFTGFEAFCDMLKTKNMTYTRISRCLLHILLGIEKNDMELGKELDYTPYARVLGFRRSAAPLLGAVREHDNTLLVTKVPEARKSLSPKADRLLELDILASELYRELARADKRQPLLNEISTPPVIL